MRLVIYARFSSHSQTEQSIEGQLKVCYEYAAANNHIVVGEYIDRAQSGTTDNRSDFQRMIADSDKKTFDAVLVYQLDRFARNRYDSAINKAKLKKNGVRVLSAKENITDDASGILIEGVLESMAEYYSVELSQKINRGMNLNAEKCLSNGSNPGLGFKVNPDRTFRVDPEEATIVQEVFERYASGETTADIIRDMNQRGIKTSLGRDFNKNSIHRMLRNKRYIGTYLYKDIETPGGMPRIIDDDLFNRVQAILDKNKAAPARSRGKEEYLLTTKLFCGYCKEMLIGYGGTGKMGLAYHYYACKKAKKKQSKKRIVKKTYIEDHVISECLSLLTEDNIRLIAKNVSAEFKGDSDTTIIKKLKSAIRDTDNAIENLWRGIEQGQSVEMLTERINMRKAERDELKGKLAIVENKQFILSEPEIYAFLDYIRKLPKDDVNKRRALINIFVNAILLYDDHYTLILNAGNRVITIDDIPLDDIESALEGETDNLSSVSSIVADAPPKTAPYHLVRCCFFAI